MTIRGFAQASILSLSLLLPAVACAQAEEPPKETAAAAADSDPWGGFSATLTGVTDYRDRGISQTDEKPAIQGSIDWEHDSGVYLGVWASNVDFNDGGEATVELDVYGGYASEWAGFDWDFMVNGIFYPGADDSLDYDLVEFSAIVGRDFGVVNPKITLIYSPENSGDSGDALYSKFSAEAPLGDTGFSATGSYGHQYIDNKVNYGVGSYNDWSLGVAYNWKGVDLALKYIDTDLQNYQCSDGCGATAVFSIGKTFGGKE